MPFLNHITNWQIFNNKNTIKFKYSLTCFYRQISYKKCL